MVEIISGLPGGGKSFMALRRILRALTEGRHVVTNVAIDSRRVAWYLSKFVALVHRGKTTRYERAKKYHSLIHKLQDEDIRHFWDYAYGGGVLKLFIVLDEIQLYFESEDYKRFPTDLKGYLAQHRKGADDLIFISQHTKNIDVHFRRMCAKYWHVNNTRGVPLLGFIRMPEAFRANCYFGESTKPLEGETFLPSKKLFALYDSYKEYDTSYAKRNTELLLKALDLRTKKLSGFDRELFIKELEGVDIDAMLAGVSVPPAVPGTKEYKIADDELLKENIAAIRSLKGTLESREGVHAF
jgi:zona occludens toxin (predicted ATPase)